jgi:hypothetical protein
MAVDKKDILTTDSFDQATPEQLTRGFVSKSTFFSLTPLASITGSVSLSGAAEETYQRWVGTGRVKEIREVSEDPTGLTADTVEIYVQARYVNSERRRHNVNARVIAETAKAGHDTRPLAARPRN